MRGSTGGPPPPPVTPGLRPVAGGATGPPPDGDAVAAVLREFAANRTALAAEVVRLRALLQDALFEVSRRAAEPVRAVTPPAPPPPRPLGPPIRPGF
jgi:hypothetical protein